MKILDDYWRSRNVDIQWHDVNVSDELLAEALAAGKNPCRVCQKIKRSYLLDFLRNSEQENKGIVVILSYTLWDLVSYSIEYLVTGIYSHGINNNARVDKGTEERFIQTAQKS